MASSSETNPFAERPQDYARARPRYPAALFAWIAAHSPATERAWDCATGSGQAAVGLAEHFEEVRASDVSAEQIACASAHPRVAYSVESAEATGFAPASFDLVTVAQALHWLDHARFWPEVARVAREGALFCAWGYDWPEGEALVECELFEPFRRVLEPFWDRRIRTLWNGYRDADLALPFERVAAPAFAIEERWTLEQLVDYLGTWSAFRRSRSDPAAVAALDAAVRKTRALVPGTRVLPVRMPLKLVAARVGGDGAIR